MRLLLVIALILPSVLTAGEMTLQDCITRALSSNLDIRIQQLDTDMARQNFNASRGIFDPGLTVSLQQQSTKSPSAWQLAGATISEAEYTEGSLGVNQLLPTGGSFSLTVDAAKNDTNSTFYTINPYYSTSFTLGLSQSLLKGFGSDITRYRITVYGNSYNTSLEQLRQQIMTTVLAVEKAYWDLRYAMANLEVKKKTLELARDLLSDTQKRIDLGTQAPIDIYQAQVGVAIREEEIIIARNAVEAAKDNLRNLLNYQGVAEWSEDIVPVDRVVMEATSFDLEKSFEKAMTMRPDIRMLHLEKETRRVDYVVARNNLLPSLDLNFRYWYTGTGGDYIDRDPVTAEIVDILPGGLSDAVDQVTGRDYGNWSAAVTLSMPIGNREAKANRTVAEINLKKVDQRMEQLEQTVFLSVRNALRELQTARQSLQASEASSILAEKNLEAERKKYDNGMTTSFQVLEVEADLSQAKSREIMARINFRKTLADYHYAVGDLLDFEGIGVEETEGVEASPWSRRPLLSFGWWLRDDPLLQGE